MASKYKDFFLAFTLLSVFITGSLLAFVVYFDIYSDFFYLTQWRQVPPIGRFHHHSLRYKVALIEHQAPGTIDLALFGSSRVEIIEPRLQLKKKTLHGLNLGYTGGCMNGIKRLISKVASTQPDATLIVGLDFMCFMNYDEGHEKYILQKFRNSAAVESIDRLFALKTVYETLEWLLFGYSRQYNDRGVRRPFFQGEAPIFDTEESLDQLVLDTISTWRDHHYNRGGFDLKNVRILQAIQSLHPETVFFINPISKWHYELMHYSHVLEEFHQWKTTLSISLDHLIDFSTNKQIITNPKNYRDTAHYNANVGEWIMADLGRYYEGNCLHHGTLISKKTYPPCLSPQEKPSGITN